MTGVLGVSETETSTAGCRGDSTGNLAGTSVLTISGYILTLTSPSNTGNFASGGGGGNCNNATLNDTYGGGQGGTGNMIGPSSGVTNTGSGSGGDRSYTWSACSHNGSDAGLF